MSRQLAIEYGLMLGVSVSNAISMVSHGDVIKWKHCPRFLVFCEGKPSDPGVFPFQKPGTRSFDVFFDKKRLNKQSEQRWFETPSRSLWRHASVLIEKYISVFVFALGTFFPHLVCKNMFLIYTTRGTGIVDRPH